MFVFNFQINHPELNFIFGYQPVDYVLKFELTHFFVSEIYHIFLAFKLFTPDFTHHHHEFLLVYGKILGLIF